MNSKLIIILYWVGLLFITSCQAQHIAIEQLGEDDKLLINSILEQIAEDDQIYRRKLSIGSTDDEVVAMFRKVTDTMSIEQYMAYKKTLSYKLNEEEKKELWARQHEADLINYKKIKSIIRAYGYPSKERIETKTDIFPVFLHPPVELDPRTYLEDMSAILLPEVLAGRMPAKKYALFYDNIKAKILKEPQLYGTNMSFNIETMKAGLPVINDIEQTNRARKKIGMVALQEGEYERSKLTVKGS